MSKYMYERIRFQELENQKESLKNEEKRHEREHKRFAIEIARGYESSNSVDALVKNANAIFDFLK